MFVLPYALVLAIRRSQYLIDVGRVFADGLLDKLPVTEASMKELATVNATNIAKSPTCWTARVLSISSKGSSGQLEKF